MPENPVQATRNRNVEVDFLYLDLSTCDRCIGTDAALNRAVELLSPVLSELGVQLDVRKTLVQSMEQARRVGFISSPTILVNGCDIAGELRESRCEPCGDACGCSGEGVDCRVWIHDGREYTEAPVGLIADAILGAVYGRPPGEPLHAGSDNASVERFFAGKARSAAGCCESTARCC